MEKIKIGDIVTVTVDRPLGSYHPEFKSMYYPVNYGYIKGVMAPDGEEQDAYILGVNEPVEEFTGEVIAIVHREDDKETKLVVSHPNARYTSEQVMHWIKFTEKFYKSQIVMKLYDIDIDPEAIFSLGFVTREGHNRYFLFKDRTPTKDEILGLLSLLSEKVTLHFWNYYHQRSSDPGSYVDVAVVNGKALIKESNHGWSGNYRSIGLDELAEFIIRNWDKDWDLRKDYMNAVALQKVFDPDRLAAEFTKPTGVFEPDYAATPW